ncbi:MAG TPA: BON domain-containing protein [Steroidobacteraceae bacterium]
MHDYPVRHRATKLCTLALSCLLVTLSGCAYQQARANCGAAGCEGDAQITSQVQALFKQHTEFGTQLYVKTLDRVVYLTGQVNTDLQRDDAESLARGVPGVQKVINNVAVAYSGR